MQQAATQQLVFSIARQISENENKLRITTVQPSKKVCYHTSETSQVQQNSSHKQCFNHAQAHTQNQVSAQQQQATRSHHNKENITNYHKSKY